MLRILTPYRPHTSHFPLIYLYIYSIILVWFLFGIYVLISAQEMGLALKDSGFQKVCLIP